MRHYFILFFLALFFAGAVVADEVPVVEATTFEPFPKEGVHVVARGETFYSIAWRYGVDYKRLASENHLKRPYHIAIGEKLYLPGYAPKTTPQAPVYVSLPAPIATITQKPVAIPLPPQKHFSKPAFLTKLFNRYNGEPVGKVWRWHWPARGAVIGGYTNMNKGINISGRKGDPVYAAAAGKVVYDGNGLRTYGNLIIIKHNSTYLTAYAHNTKTFVHQGDWVRYGQKIAEMGDTGTNRVMLHFEIRKEGAPVNPLRYLSSR